MENYNSNSNKSKQSNEPPEKKIEKVISGTVKTKKKSGVRKLADVFVPEDRESVKSYIMFDVIVPYVKKAITDAVEAILYPGMERGKRNSPSSKISYRNYYDRNEERRVSNTRMHSVYDYDDIILSSYGEAEEVLSKMDELIDTYGMASVADLYDLVGISGNHTDNKYGWTDVRSAHPVRVRDGYALKLPKALPLN